MRVSQLSSAEIIKFHKELAAAFGVRFVNGGPLARLAKYALDRIAKPIIDLIPDRVLDLRPMCIWRLIVLPYAPGTSDVSNTTQIITAIHEVEHSNRMRNVYPGTVAQWYREYFLSGNFRALEESSAWETCLDVVYWYNGRMRVISLKDYVLSSAALALANRSYGARGRQLMKSGRGWTGSKVSAKAIDILQSLGVDKI